MASQKTPYLFLYARAYEDVKLVLAGWEATLLWPHILCLLKQRTGVMDNDECSAAFIAATLRCPMELAEPAVAGLKRVGLLVEGSRSCPGGAGGSHEREGWVTPSWDKWSVDPRIRGEARAKTTVRDRSPTVTPPLPTVSTDNGELELELEVQQRLRERATDSLGEALRDLARPMTPHEHSTAEWVEATQQRLGCPRSRSGSDVHARWLGIARNPNRAEVDALVEWAIGIGDGAAFLRCFDDSGQIVAKRPAKVDRASKEDRAIALRSDAHDLADVLQATGKDCTPENVAYWIDKHGKPWTVDELRPMARRVLIDLGIAS